MKFKVKLLIAALLGLALGVSTLVYQARPVEYNIGGCGVGDFAGAHIVVTSSKIVVTHYSFKKDQQEKLPHPVVYEFVGKDDEGRHYKSENMEIVISKQDSKGIVGKLEHNGEIAAVIYGKPGKAEDLAKDSLANFKTCISIQDELGQDDNGHNDQPVDES